MNDDVVLKIVEGYSALITKDKKVEDMALRRSAICSDCPQLDKALGFFLFCKKCGCYVPAKVRSIHSSCPLSKWLSEAEPSDPI